MKSHKKIITFLFLIQITNSFCSTTSKYFIKQNDSIKVWIKKSKSKNLSNTYKKKTLTKAYKYIINQDKDLSIDLSSIAYQFYKLKDTVTFFKINKVALGWGKKNENYFTIGDTYWNNASFYLNIENYNKAFLHFNLAYKAFKKGKHKYETAKMIYGMAHVKGLKKDFAGSEILNIKAIELFKELKNNKNLYISYNHLALLHKEINELNKALEYHNKSLEYIKKIKNNTTYYQAVYNNIALVYVKQKKYSKALSYFNKILDDKSLKHKKIDRYARALDNKSYCKLLMRDTLSIEKDLLSALRIRDSIKNKAGVLINKIHLSDFYLYKKDTIKALKFAKEANYIANKIKNGRDYLTTLKQLANLDIQNSKKYLDRYIEFNDSLISSERKTQNKFTRIEFETDEYIAETKRLNEQQIWTIAISIAGALILSLLYFLRVQKVKNEKLSIEAEQQKANEEVYILTLQQQAKLEEEKIKERNRISEELHDGILGKLFGTRFGLGFLPIKGDNDLLEKHQSYLNELQEIEKEIRDVSHKLSDNFDNSNINFITIIKQLLKDKSEQGNFEHQFTFDDTISWSQINEVTKANIYRIVQEAMQNILKHAKAKKVILEFSNNQQNLIIKLKDDGTGFDTKKAKKGIGLKNIKSRVEKLKGTVAFSSEIKKGTTLLIKIPYILSNE